MTSDLSAAATDPAPLPQTKSGPQVAVIIPCFNSSEFLIQCLASIMAMSQVPIEVIVVDDGSSQDIRRVVDRFAPAVRYIRQPNQGPAVARNTGILASHAAYIRFLDADDTLIPDDHLVEQLSIMEAHPEVGLVYGQAVKTDELGNTIGLRKPAFTQESYIRSGMDELPDLLRYNHITTSTVMVRRSVIDRAGWFRREYVGPEDWDCWLRICRISSIAYVARPMATYRVHTGSVTALYKLEAWKQAHTTILDQFFADQECAKKFESIRVVVYARLSGQLAWLAFRSGHSSTARRYAWQALHTSVTDRRWSEGAGFLVLLVRSQVPPKLGRPIERICRRCRRWLRARGAVPSIGR